MSSRLLDDVGAHLGVVLRRRATVWVGAAWVLLGPLFGMVVPYLVYRLGGIPVEAAGPVLERLTPSALPATVLAGYTPYGGAYLLLLGAVLVGNEYRWGTVATLLLRRAGRSRVVLAQSLALVAVVGLVVVAEFGVAALTAVLVTGLEGTQAPGPDPVAVVLALLGGWLAGSAFALVGALLAHTTRSAAAAAGIGLVGVLGIETAVRGLLAALATPLPRLAGVADGLLGPAVGALAVGLGEPAVPGPFGVGDGGSPVLAVAVLVCWAVAAVALSAVLVSRRDVPVGSA